MYIYAYVQEKVTAHELPSWCGKLHAPHFSQSILINYLSFDIMHTASQFVIFIVVTDLDFPTLQRAFFEGQFLSWHESIASNSLRSGVAHRPS